ncbi:hypothetical protein H7097_00675 [Aeromicrobium sp.]|nr:hypothetical protein [Candidatus Saccharibacteria bacterium]
MKSFRGLTFGLALLAFAASILVSMVPAYAATASTGLTASAARPGTAWASSVSAPAGEIVNVLLTYVNDNQSGQKFVIIQDTLPTGATYLPGSAYLFSPAGSPGVKQADTITTSGISTGALKPGGVSYIQFQMKLPPAANLNCGNNSLTNRAVGSSRTGNKTYAASSAIIATRTCTAALAPAATPPQPVATPAVPAVVKQVNKAVNILAVDNSVHTTNNQTPATPQVASATTTAAAPAPTSAAIQPVATTSAKGLVNTGPGSIIGLFLVAVIVGTIGSRLVLYRLLGA